MSQISKKRKIEDVDMMGRDLHAPIARDIRVQTFNASQTRVQTQLFNTHTQQPENLLLTVLTTMNNMRASLKIELKAELRAELKAELKAELLEELKAEMKPNSFCSYIS